MKIMTSKKEEEQMLGVLRGKQKWAYDREELGWGHFIGLKLELRKGG